VRLQIILNILGILLALFSTSLLPPLALSLIYSDNTTTAFLVAYLVTLATGLTCYLPTRHQGRDLRLRDGFLIVVLFWTVLASFGALPLFLSNNPAMGLTDAFFESMSGLTTTGATVLVGIDDLPISVRYYRQQLQWLGGMGIVVLAVAVMPMLGIGGMQLYRAETPGPIKNSKLTPRITETAKALWYIYLGLTVACAIGYWLAGMTVFDAIGHSFSTVAIGGFSTHDASIGFFDSPLISAIASLFMIAAGMNFALHFLALRQRNFLVYLQDTEVRVFLGFLLLVTVLTCGVLWSTNTFSDATTTLWHGIFQVISIGTTTGFTTSGFHWWPSLLPVLLIMMSGIGGCAGSTAGGVKVIRMILLYKQGRREINQLIHPSAFFPIKLGGKPVPDNVINAIWGFFALYIFSYLVLSLAMTATGADPLTAFSAVTACLNNLGPGLGAVSKNYAAIDPAGKWILSGAMLMGRLELFTLLVLLTPAFWRS
jgi:trk system potassium uptake protein TrkH